MKPWEETWRVVLAKLKDADGPDTHATIHNERDRWVARFSPSPGESPDYENDRAELAAAAPELYRALEACADSLANLLNTNEGPVLGPAFAALRKARGES